MTFPQWYFRNVIEKDRTRQDFSRMEPSKKWKIINNKIRDLRKNNPKRYDDLFSQYNEPDSPSLFGELPLNSPQPIGFKELHRLSEMPEKERVQERTWNDEVERQLLHFKNAKISTLIMALRKVSK